jgi:hypothetical protein
VIRSYLSAGALAIALLVAPSSGFAAGSGEVPGIPLKIVVLDTAGKPVSTAQVRNPQEADRHPVNAVDGATIIDAFYLPDGTEVKIVKGMTVTFEISAAGYVNQMVTYTVRKRKNVIQVNLAAMKLDDPDDTDDDVNINFGRDKPID